MRLYELLAARSDEVMHRWKAAVSGDLAPEAMPHLELVDHLPQYLQQVIAALQDEECRSSPRTDGTITNAGHGAQRLRLGFSLDSVVREYGVIKDAIVATAR